MLTFFGMPIDSHSLKDEGIYICRVHNDEVLRRKEEVKWSTKCQVGVQLCPAPKTCHLEEKRGKLHLNGMGKKVQQQTFRSFEDEQPVTLSFSLAKIKNELYASFTV